jgi:hypothetical protein
VTKAELLAKLGELTNSDPESSHQVADALLLQFIADEEIEAAWDKIRKWYA